MRQMSDVAATVQQKKRNKEGKSATARVNWQLDGLLMAALFKIATPNHAP